MPEITPTFVMQYERRMRAITENTYAARLADEATWWNKVSKTMTLEGKTQRLTWLLETAMIEPVGPSGSGSITFEDLVTQTIEYPVIRHGKGIKVQRDQLEDLDGTGLDILASWSGQIGNEIAYYPQRLMAQLLLNGTNTDGSANAYDGIRFFADNTTNTVGGVSVNGHPFNPFQPALGGYQNWCHGAASGSYPGALPIDDSVNIETALTNLGKAIAHIANCKMANGVDPRFLKPVFVLCPPRMAPRVRQLMDAKFIAQASTSGGGASDVAAFIGGWNLGTPVVANELAGAFTYANAQMSFVTSGGQVKIAPESLTGSDTTYYIFTQDAMSTNLGSLLFLQRKPFKVTYYTGDSGGTAMSEHLDLVNEFEYHVQGRMSVGYGHPFGVYRFDST